MSANGMFGEIAWEPEDAKFCLTQIMAGGSQGHDRPVEPPSLPPLAMQPLAVDQQPARTPADNALRNFVNFGNAAGMVEISARTIAESRQITFGILAHSTSENLGQIDRDYIVENRTEVKRFIREHRLRTPLQDAVEPLRRYFGGAPLKTLQLVSDDEGAETLFCLVRFAGTVEQATLARREFDENWWVARSYGLEGKLNFDYELV